MINDKYPFVNLPLPFALNALEPHISALTMEVHHDRLLAKYINNLNKIIEQNLYLQTFSLRELLTRTSGLPAHTAIVNNAGGVFNHRFFFSLLSPAPSHDNQDSAHTQNQNSNTLQSQGSLTSSFPAPSHDNQDSAHAQNQNSNTLQSQGSLTSSSPAPSHDPHGKLLSRINADFGSFERFKAEFKTSAMAVFGSGYVWLVADDGGKLSIISTANQDTPLPMRLNPVITLDVWEHAYYLTNQNFRDQYIDAFFDVLDYTVANSYYLTAISTD